MAASTSLYRKYRSQTFDELVGQEPVVRTLKNAIASGRVAHAYLFTGPRGVGKTSAARLLARAANCLSGSDEKPCNQCANCTAATRDIATDLIEIDAASNTGVDNIRDVIERANFAPSVWNTKFYIVDEVHMLSISAFNALLKTLEEPPPQTAFILATTEVHKVPATVASRCQRFDFRRVPIAAMVSRLEYICGAEGIGVEREALELVARHATGSLRDALSLLDQLRVYCEGTITLVSVQSLLGASGIKEVSEFADLLIAGDLASGLRHVNRVLDDGLDLRQFNRQIVEYLRDMMLVKTGAAAADSALLDVTEEIKQRMRSQAEQVSVGKLLAWIEEFAGADGNLRSSSYRQLPLEMALVKSIAGPAETVSQLPVRETTPDRVEGAGIIPAVRPGAPAKPETPRPTVKERAAPPEVAGPVEGDPPPPPIHMEMQLPESHHSQSHGEKSEEVEGTGEGAGSEAAGHPAVDGEESELDRVKRLWGDIIDQINARSKNIAAVFRAPDLVRPHSVSGNVYTLSFRHQIQAERCRKEPWRDLIEQAFTRVLGREARVDSILFDDESKATGDVEGEHSKGQNGNGPRPPRGGQSPYETPRGRAALNIFGIDKFEEPQ